MEPRIEKLPLTKYIGIRSQMSFINDKTPDLWRAFMPRRNEVQDRVGNELYSINVYTHDFFSNFNISAEYEKWGAVKVLNSNHVPDDMETIQIEGWYAIVLYKGRASEAQGMYEFMFHTWLPDSDYNLDYRPHFAVMGSKYSKEDPNSEEDLCIPIIHKNHEST